MLRTISTRTRAVSKDPAARGRADHRSTRARTLFASGTCKVPVKAEPTPAEPAPVAEQPAPQPPAPAVVESPKPVEEIGIDKHADITEKPVDSTRELQEWLIDRYDRMIERVLNEAFERPAAAPAPEAKPVSKDAASLPVTRRWTDDTGRYEIWGQLLSRDAKQVRILKTNGRTTTVPWYRLSYADRQYATETHLTSAN